MDAAIEYALWFVNNAAVGGNVCVFQNVDDVTVSGGGELKTLAWMVTGANTGSEIKFLWSTSYNYVWFDYTPTLTQGITSATLDSQVTLSKNQYGYVFSTLASVAAGELSIKMDQSIPAANNTVAGIGMSGAGTFAVAAQPNIAPEFTPAETAELTYLINFNCDNEVNSVINIENITNAATITFPYGVNTMTATYKNDGTWTVTNGAPPQSRSLTGSTSNNQYIYQPGIGIKKYESNDGTTKKVAASSLWQDTF